MEIILELPKRYLVSFVQGQTKQMAKKSEDILRIGRKSVVIEKVANRSNIYFVLYLVLSKRNLIFRKAKDNCKAIKHGKP